MACPRCGQEAGDAASCPRCGVVFAKLLARPPAPARSVPSGARSTPAAPPAVEPERTPRAAGAGKGLVLGSALLAVATFVWFLRGGAPEVVGALGRAEPPAEAAVATPVPDPAGSPESIPPLAADTVPEAALARSAGLTQPDRKQAEALQESLRRGVLMGPAQVHTVLDLVARYPEEPLLRVLAERVLVSVADNLRQARSYTEATLLLRRTLSLKPDSRPARVVLVSVLLDASDWTSAESAARDLLSLFPGDAFSLRSLGFALLRQDRNREAAEALRQSLEIEDDATARRMLAHLEKGMRDEKGMSEKQLAHFHVRYDGSEHEDVGREILRALERHFSALTSVFDHQPRAPIPVILFSREEYYDAAGAPRWSGGVFNHTDGRIRIPIGGLTSSLTPDIDNVLVHEVAHAFIHDMSGGACPRDIHEGLAQYMEGKRIAAVLPPDQLKALADGRMRGVGGFYLGALAFVEHLMGQRGQGGINELLKAMGETGDVDAAFRRVHGQDHAAAARAFADRLRLQYGS